MRVLDGYHNMFDRYEFSEEVYEAKGMHGVPTSR